MDKREDRFGTSASGGAARPGADAWRRDEAEIGASLGEAGARRGSMAEMTQRLSAHTDEALAQGRDMANAARSHAADLAADLEGRVRQNPLLALVTALGVGLVIGAMMRR